MVLILKCLELSNYNCAAILWKLRRRQIAEFPLGLARVDVCEVNLHRTEGKLCHK